MGGLHFAVCYCACMLSGGCFAVINTVYVTLYSFLLVRYNVFSVHLQFCGLSGTPSYTYVVAFIFTMINVHTYIYNLTTVNHRCSLLCFISVSFVTGAWCQYQLRYGNVWLSPVHSKLASWLGVSARVFHLLYACMVVISMFLCCVCRRGSWLSYVLYVHLCQHRHQTRQTLFWCICYI